MDGGFIMLDINKMRESQRLNNRNQTSVHLAYYLYSDDDFLTVLLPEKPTMRCGSYSGTEPAA